MKKAIILCLLPFTAQAQSLDEQINAVDAAKSEEYTIERKIEAVKEQRAAQIRHEKLNDKKREQDYEDQLRALQVEALKTRVARENDVIDQELKEKAARTDVIKSEADSNRHISEGAKTLMEKEGEARVKKNSWW